MAVTVAFNAREEGLSAANRKHTKEAKDHEQAIRDTARAARESEREQRRSARSLERDLRNVINQYLGVTAAISQINRAYNTWIQNERERVQLTKSGIDAARNFALLQPAGTIDQRISMAAALGVQTGRFRTEEEQAAVFDITQAMQSAAGGDFAEGMRRAFRVLQASNVGLQPQTARELVNQAIVQGQQDPTSFLRMGVAAGQLSLRTPQEIAQGARALIPFDDKAFAFSVAAQLGDAFGNQAETFVTAAARTLESIDLRRQLGVDADATIRETFDAMRARVGTDLTAAEAEQLGLGNVRDIKAMRTLLENQTQLMSEAEQIRQSDRPGFLLQRQRELEAESPQFARQQRMAEQQSEIQFRRMFDERAAGAAERRTQMAVDRLRQGRPDSVFGFDVATQEGEVSPLMEFFMQMQRAIPDPPFAQGLRGQVREGLDERTERQTRAMEETRDILRQNNNQALPNRPEN